MALLELKNLHVALEDGTEIVKGVDLAVDTNEVHAIMGPNGSGKSTLAYAIAGHPAYEVTEGQILLDGEDITEAGADERSQKGLFLAFQYPHAIPGVTVTNFLRHGDQRGAQGARTAASTTRFRSRSSATDLFAEMDRLKVSRELASRYLNDGFSGGEKKRVEILQMAMLKPRIAVLDETDSGLDIDALKVVAGGVKELVGPEMGALVITHYQRILNYITPDYVHVFVDGKIVEEWRPGARTRAGEVRVCTMGEGEGGGLMAQTETEIVQGIGSDYGTKYGFSNPDEAKDYFFKSGRGISHELVEAISEHKNEPDWMRQVPPQVARLLPRAAAADRGAATSPPRSTSRTSSTTSSRPRIRSTSGRTCRPTSRTRGTSSASPRRRRSTSPASVRSTSPRSSTTSSRSTSRRRA